jgi:predicted 3-demethylubiquinone-9 3-methyltransferase (glyoxalase superfamily)
MPKITPWLWFDTEGEEATEFYTSVFPNSRIKAITRYGAAGPRPEGTVMTVAFELDGQDFAASTAARSSSSARPSRSS